MAAHMGTAARHQCRNGGEGWIMPETLSALRDGLLDLPPAAVRHARQMPAREARS